MILVSCEDALRFQYDTGNDIFNPTWDFINLQLLTLVSISYPTFEGNYRPTNSVYMLIN